MKVPVDAPATKERPYTDQQNMQCSCQDYACTCHKECFCRIIDKSIAALKAEANGNAPRSTSYDSASSSSFPLRFAQRLVAQPFAPVTCRPSGLLRPLLTPTKRARRHTLRVGVLQANRNHLI